MKKASTKSANGKESRPKIKLGILDLEHSKNAVLRSLGSPDWRRGYKHAIDEFDAWYCYGRNVAATFSRRSAEQLRPDADGPCPCKSQLHVVE